jgi:hypothetical protein
MPITKSAIGGYYNRFDPTKNYDEHLFRAGKVLQSAELNEVQSNVFDRVRKIADTLFKDGDVLRDAQIIVNASNGETLAQSGAIYLYGAVRGVPEATFVISTTGIVDVGVYLTEHVITELEDPALRDPATGTRNYEEPGAVRLQVNTEWGFSGDGKQGDFYPVYTVEDGVLRAKEPPPNLDAVTQALARYDRDSSGGTYVVDGLTVLMGDPLEGGEQVYTLTEGRARVNGYGVELYTSRRLVYDAAPDLRYIDSEPHTSTTTDTQRVNLDRTPVGEITQVRITTEKTVTLTHGSFTGVADPLPDTSVLSILSVSQSGTTYAQGADYKLTAGQVDWSPTGAEPAPGSTYSVTYRYIASVAPVGKDAKGFSVAGAVIDSLILVSYNHQLPRIDRLAMTAEGQVIWIKGVAADRNPALPWVSGDTLPLATVYQSWDEYHRVVNDSVRTVKMDELYSVNEKLDHILALIAQQRLEASINMIEAGMKKGILVDPFLDNGQRDAGREQTALIYDGDLSLAIDADAYQLVGDIAAPVTLAHTNLVTLEQPLKTGDMRINPYDAFAPMPDQVKLNPAFDNWTTGQIIATKSNSIGGGGNSFSQSSSLQTVGQHAADFLRPITVGYTISGWESGETVFKLTFDGITLTPANQANTGGTATGQFTIPDKVPAGRKSVMFIGTAGSVAEATFTGSGTVLEQVQTITTVWRNVVLANTDPLAQTFTLSESCQITGFDLWFTAKQGKILLQIRDVQNGVPGKTIFAEKYVDPASIIVTGASTRILLDAPFYAQAGTEYALVALCDEAVSKLALAELGKYDLTNNVWVTSQPYQVGVLLSSSNAATWTPHQDRDLTFRILKGQYSENSHTVALGAVQVTDATDLILYAPLDRPEAATTAEYSLALPGGTTVIVDSGQHIQLAEAITGEVGISVTLTGTSRVAPVIYPGSQLIAGTVATEGDYISRAILAGSNARVRIIYDALLPGGAAVEPTVQSITAEEDDWTATSFISSQPVDDGFVELTYELASITADMVRVRLALTGTAAARPHVRNLRVIIT